MPFLPKNLEAFRRSLGLSQDALARKLGCSKTTVANWEQNRSTPAGDKVDQLHQLAQDAHLQPGSKDYPQFFDHRQ